MRPTEFVHISDRLMLLLVWTARVREGWTVLFMWMAWVVLGWGIVIVAEC